MVRWVWLRSDHELYGYYAYGATYNRNKETPITLQTGRPVGDRVVGVVVSESFILISPSRHKGNIGVEVFIEIIVSLKIHRV